VNRNGVATTVRRSCATWTVATMVVVWARRVRVPKDGAASIATLNCAMRDATSTVSVRTEPACAWPDGMGNIARSRDARLGETTNGCL
jgi:hypothetical protein